jgi:hypothetical protein
VADDRALTAPLDVALGGATVLQDRDARLGAVDRDQDLLRQERLPSGCGVTGARAP